MGFKKILLKIYYFSSLSKEKTDYYQEKIREAEWDAIKHYISKNSMFLDVGCGAGYAMLKAQEEFNCNCFGVDPDPGGHGVGRYKEFNKRLNIKKGVSEDLPFQDESFDIIFCSHVLEHVENEKLSLEEMKRVLKPEGTLIIGMPTATMSWISFFTELLFTTHQRLFNLIFGYIPFVKAHKISLINFFLPTSHSFPRAKTILYDFKHYTVKNWREIVGTTFNVKKELLPALYPYPQYIQLFKMRKNVKKSSSVFFIVKKK